MIILCRTFLIMLVCTVSCVAIAHDTIHIHPLLTDKISSLIQISDTQGAYQEIYVEPPNDLKDPALPQSAFQGLYWGADFDQGSSVLINGAQQEKIDYLLKLDASKFTRYNNAIDGVIQEDLPASRVFNHFYQGESGGPLTLNGTPPPGYGSKPSSYVAMQYFNESIAWMSGYEPTDANSGSIGITAKRFAFFIFGQTLHHLEDMSSPAHIHNDPHLDIFDSEKDDYEGNYLPFLKIDNGIDLGTYFKSYTTSDALTAIALKTVTNPWNDIWGINTNSMVKYFYDRSSFEATLSFPLDTVVKGVIVQHAQPPPSPTGELAEMFPCKNPSQQTDYTVSNCLHWDEDALYVQAHWRINAVGNFQHQYVAGSDDDWWPVSYEVDHSIVTTSNPGSYNGVSSRYYIEQLSTGNSDSNIGGNPVIPSKMRNDFNVPWTGNFDPTDPGQYIDNNEALWDIYAKNLLNPAVEYGAAFTEYWYDVANTPPYLVSVEVTQSGEPVYSASWRDVVQQSYPSVVDVAHCYFHDLACLSTQLTVSGVKERILNIDTTKSGYITGGSNLVITLTFNESINQISDFHIGSLDATTNAISAIRSSNDTIWTITVGQSELSGLSGKQQLTIKAEDKNKHTSGADCSSGVDSSGSELDGTPDTPARRNVELAMQVESNGKPKMINCYPWYKDGASTGDSGNNTVYSYDPENGDQNHWLVFDTAPPSATVNVDTAL